MDFLRARKGTGFDRFDAAVLAVYAGVLAWTIHFYQPFVDEAQAWLIARDSSLPEILIRRLHYEGHPALWPMILWVAARLHLPYDGINWMGGAFALVGIYILLRFSPFPRIFRWLLPFTFFLQYQYAAIARPYVLFTGLLFTLCILFILRKPRPLLFGLVAGLLANISLHSAILAGMFSLLYVYELCRLRRQSPGRVAARRVAAGAGLFVLFLLCAGAVAVPAPDATVSFRPNETVVKPNALLPNTLLMRLIPEERLPSSAPPLDAPLNPDYSSAITGQYPAIVVFAVKTIILGISAAFYPIAKSNLLALCFIACLWLWLRSRGCARLILPFVVSCLLSVQVFVFDHHTGMFLLSLVAAVWIALNIETDDQMPHRRLPWIEPAFCVVALVVVALQIGWSIHCIRGVTFGSSDPGKETAAFLKSNCAGKRIAGFGFESISTEAYAQQKLFSNQPHAFWVWGVNVLPDRRRTEALAQHPDVVVAAEVITGEEVFFNQWMKLDPLGRRTHLPMIEFWQHNGYRITHRFCGDQFRRGGVSYTFCEVILELDSAVTDAPLSTQVTP